ncbi:MAG: Uma2 family endonuclease [Bradymonadia bacterium]
MPTPPSPEHRITAEAFFRDQHRYPDGCELVDGEVVELSPMKAPHGRTCALISTALGNFFRAHRDRYSNADILTGDVGYQLGDFIVRAPDIAVHLDVPEYTETWLRTPPLVAIEVISPNDRWRAVEQKAHQWLQFGVSEVWLADPTTQSVSVRSTTETRRFSEGEALKSSALPAFQPTLSELFQL